MFKSCELRVVSWCLRGHLIADVHILHTEISQRVCKVAEPEDAVLVIILRPLVHSPAILEQRHVTVVTDKHHLHTRFLITWHERHLTLVAIQVVACVAVAVVKLVFNQAVIHESIRSGLPVVARAVVRRATVGCVILHERATSCAIVDLPKSSKEAADPVGRLVQSIIVETNSKLPYMCCFRYTAALVLLPQALLSAAFHATPVVSPAHCRLAPVVGGPRLRITWQCGPICCVESCGALHSATSVRHELFMEPL